MVYDPINSPSNLGLAAFLLPQLTTAERNAIKTSSYPSGWIVFNTDTQVIEVLTLDGWVQQGILSLAGALDGTSSAKTTTYTVQNSDKRSTLSLGGNNCYTVTVPAASGLDSDFQVRLYNADSGRAKWLAINGYSGFFLWPGQNVVIQNIGSTWQLFPAQQQWEVPGSQHFFVDPGGSDAGGANDGLTQASAFATIQHAWTVIATQTDISNPGINLTPGATYTITASIDLFGDIGTSSFGRLLAINGDSTLANPPTISTSSNVGAMINVYDGMWVQISGVSFVSTTNDNTGVFIGQNSLGDLGDCEWNMPTALFVQVSANALCNISGTHSIGTCGGSTLNFINAINGASVIFQSPTINGNSNPIDFAGGFVAADLNSRILLAGTTFSNTGSFTGDSAVATHGSFVSKGGVTLPGTGTAVDSTSAVY